MSRDFTIRLSIDESETSAVYGLVHIGPVLVYSAWYPNARFPLSEKETDDIYVALLHEFVGRLIKAMEDA